MELPSSPTNGLGCLSTHRRHQLRAPTCQLDNRRAPQHAGTALLPRSSPPTSGPGWTAARTQVDKFFFLLYFLFFYLLFSFSFSFHISSVKY